MKFSCATKKIDRICGHTKETRRQSMGLQSNQTVPQMQLVVHSFVCVRKTFVMRNLFDFAALCRISVFIQFFCFFFYSSFETFFHTFTHSLFQLSFCLLLTHSLFQFDCFELVWSVYRFVFQHTEVWRPNDFKLQQQNLRDFVNHIERLSDGFQERKGRGGRVCGSLQFVHTYTRTLNEVEIHIQASCNKCVVVQTFISFYFILFCFFFVALSLSPVFYLYVFHFIFFSFDGSYDHGI